MRGEFRVQDVGCRVGYRVQGGSRVRSGVEVPRTFLNSGSCLARAAKSGGEV